MSASSSRKPSGSSTHEPLDSPSHVQTQMSHNSSSSVNVHKIGISSTNSSRTALNSGWQVWGSAVQVSRNASGSSTTSANDIPAVGGYRPAYPEPWHSSTSQSTSVTWDESSGATQQVEILPSDATSQSSLYHARSLARQPTVTQASFSASVIEGRSKHGQYSPQRFESSLGMSQGSRISASSSPTRGFPAPAYPGPPSANINSNITIGAYDTLQVPISVNDELSLALRDMSIEDEYQAHLPLQPIVQTSPLTRGPPPLPPLLRPFGGCPPPDYNNYFMPPRESYPDYYSYGYVPTDPALYGSPAMNHSPVGIYHGLQTPHITQPNCLPMLDIQRAQPGVRYEYGAMRSPSQYYYPPQAIMYPQPPPPLPLSHSSLITAQVSAALMSDKKKELQYNMHQQMASQTLMFNAIQSTPSLHAHGYVDYTQFPFIIPAPLGTYSPPPSHVHQHNVRGRRQQPSDSGSALRSPVLEEFRGNKTRKWELRDIFGFVVEFSGDQHGSRFIQQKLESANSEEKQAIFDEIVPSNALQLVQDVFGNYVIQKLFEHGTQIQKTRLAQTMEGRVLFLSSQMYGCRVVQKAIEYILPEQQAIFVKELEPYILQCIKDPNGNHVIQKLIERVSPDRLSFVHVFRSNVYNLATHPFGCRVLQRCLEHLPEENTCPVMEEIQKYATTLMQDQFGNYVIQYILEHGKPNDKAMIVSHLSGQLLMMAKHKFASNVCEKALICADLDMRQKLIDEIITLKADGVSPITSMMKDQFANYVLQRAMIIAVGEQKDVLFSKVKPQLVSMRRYQSGYTKHLAAIERLLERGNSQTAKA